MQLLKVHPSIIASEMKWLLLAAIKMSTNIVDAFGECTDFHHLNVDINLRSLKLVVL